MLDHPGWLIDVDGARRVVRKGAAVWRILRAPEGKSIDVILESGAGKPPIVDAFDPVHLPLTNELTRVLVNVGPICRLLNEDLWDALATGVIRQVIRAGQARRLYMRLCTDHGQRVGTMHLFPTPDVVLGLTDEEFGRLGLSFKRDALRAAATAVLVHGDTWRELAPAELLVALQSVHRVGPWTAAATVADLSNDFSFYPFGDLAVRTWAGHLAPGMDWPRSETAFAACWRSLAPPEQLSELTALTLAHGSRR